MTRKAFLQQLFSIAGLALLWRNLTQSVVFNAIPRRPKPDLVFSASPLYPVHAPLIRTLGTPAAGQYAVDARTGVYTFNAADAGKDVTIIYTGKRVLPLRQSIPRSGPVNTAANWKALAGERYLTPPFRV
jgi:hypothetical protein